MEPNAQEPNNQQPQPGATPEPTPAPAPQSEPTPTPPVQPTAAAEPAPAPVAPAATPVPDAMPETPAPQPTEAAPSAASTTPAATAVVKKGFFTKGLPKDIHDAYMSFDTRTRMLILAGAGIVLVIFLVILWSLFSAIFGPQAPQNIGFDPNNQQTFLTPADGKFIIVRQKDSRGTYQELRDLSNVAAPAELQFDANTYLPRETANYRVISYEWDLEGAGTFDDKQTTAIATHTYIDRGLKNGKFDISLRVTKEILTPHGQYKTPGERVTEVYGPTTGGVSFTITTVKPFIDVITTPQDLNGVAPFKVDFDASRSRAEGEIDQYLWDFDGDGVTDEEGPKVSHTFTRAGVENVTVEVVDLKNLSSKKTIKIMVDETVLPEPVIEASTLTGDAPLKITFDGSKSTAKEGQITEYNWTFKEGMQPVSGKTAEFTFDEPGKYNVVLEVKTDLGAANKSAVLITVNTSKLKPTARIRAEGTGGDGKRLIASTNAPLSGRLPVTVNFDAGTSTDPNNSIVDWKWDFNGDSKFDTSGEKVNNTFRLPGSYLVTLQVENAAHLTSTASMTVVVEAEDLVADVFADPISGTAPLTVAFDGAGSSYKNGAITSYEWNFGDGSRPRLTGAQTTYEYTAPGIYNVELKVRTADGQSKTTTKIITVLQEVLSPKFTASPKTGAAPLTVDFNASESVGEIVSYRWNFGDGTSDTGIKVKHVYNTPGNYSVELRVYDKYGAMLPYKEDITVRQP